MFGQTTDKELCSALMQMDLNNGVNFDLKQFITSDEGEAVDDAIESELYLMIKKMKKNGTTRAQLEYRHY